MELIYFEMVDLGTQYGSLGQVPIYMDSYNNNGAKVEAFCSADHFLLVLSKLTAFTDVTWSDAGAMYIGENKKNNFYGSTLFIAWMQLFGRLGGALIEGHIAKLNEAGELWEDQDYFNTGKLVCNFSTIVLDSFV
jgi:hypothetical protein